MPEAAPIMTNLICPTEEYAIRDFMSCWRTQIRLVIMPPHIAKAVRIIFKLQLMGGIR